MPDARWQTVHVEGPRTQPDQKFFYLKITIAVGLICGFCLSWRLWISSRLFPLTPVVGFLPLIPLPLDYLWFSLLLTLLLVIIVVAWPQKTIFLFLALAGLLALWDQMRWQPWFFEYLFLLAAIGLYARKKDSVAFNACRVVLIFTYLWSGLQKLNANFIARTWPDIAGHFLRFLPAALNKLSSLLALVVPLTEIAIAAGLLTRRYRNFGVVLAVATHLFILVLLISSGENTVVWPWNIAMAFLVVILFWQDKETTPSQVLVPGNVFHAAILLVFALLPPLSLVDLWDSYLSSALYSGNTYQAAILVSPSVIPRLPAAVQPHIWEKSEPMFLDINRWSYGELNVPVYPEPRIYRNIAKQICAYGESSPDIKLVIKGKPGPLSGHRKSEYYDCDHL
jgi:hypothetical protein